jgi:competence ComEA-like helix-hairpin-helix protein
MSDNAFKDYMAQREAKLRSSSSGGSWWMWLLAVAAILLVVIFLLLRTDPNAALVNPNTADMKALMTLPGVGPEIAEKMVKQRKVKPFTQANDLLDVPGIGPKTLDKMRQRLKFEP